MIQRRLLNLCSPSLLHLRVRLLSTTTPLSLIQKWRKERGLPLNPNAYGVLTDSADYTFLDGRLTPLGVNQKKRIFKEKQILEDIVKLTGEIDFAIERHKKLLSDEEDRKKQILDSKLKPKGLALLKSK